MTNTYAWRFIMAAAAMEAWPELSLEQFNDVFRSVMGRASMAGIELSLISLDSALILELTRLYGPPLRSLQ